MKKILILSFLLSIQTVLKADEGMWVPIYLYQNLERMQELGLKLSAEDIYSINKACLKDAIVHFGSGCTGVIVSTDGLFLTNHHCGFGSIQRNSSLDHDYLTNGFWAGSRSEELPNPGLTVTRIVRMEDITQAVLQGVPAGITESERSRWVRKRTDSIEKSSVEGTWYSAKVRPFFNGNQYILIIQEVFRDIRLVGAPPASIGNFGGDTDNWVWPRHTGDFSVFRIYADTANKPADYNVKNVPYKPLWVIPVASGGVREGDFTMVFGFPGATREYLPSCAVELIAMKENPIRVSLRGQRLEIMKSYMERDRLIRIQYAAKSTRISNGWKKMIGESRGIHRLDGIDVKRREESRYQSQVKEDLIAAFRRIYGEYEPYALAAAWMTEGPLSIELVQFADRFAGILEEALKKPADKQKWEASRLKLLAAATSFYKEYQPSIDEKVAVAMIESLMKGMEPRFRPEVLYILEKKYSGETASFIRDRFGKTILTDSAATLKLIRTLTSRDASRLSGDPAIILSRSFYNRYNNDIRPVVQRYQPILDSIQRLYMAELIRLQPGRHFYPDANATMRVAFGKVAGYHPADAVEYRYYTTLEGVMLKADTAMADYRVDPKLRDLYLKKDFGPYADRDGTLHVAFTGTNHTTGGNSGSPVLNEKGELIGLNFDRNWEGTMSDLMYDPDQCRNITLDIRYCLFIMDKYAGATGLVREINGKP